jgi:hypothetical protein
MRWKINWSGATFSADQRAVIGLSSARNATLDSVANNAWFRVEGANLNLLFETDDGTTDTDDQDTTVDLVDDTFITTRIDLTDLSAVKFLVNAEDGNGFVVKGTASVPAMTGGLQFFMEMQKDAGAETEAFVIDYVKILSKRS